MANPVYTARVTPTGRAMPKGYRCLVTLSLDSDIAFWEKTVKPPGADGGDLIMTSTQHNATYNTFAPQALVTLTPMELTVAWVSASYAQVMAVINLEGSITVTFPSGNSPVNFFGVLNKFEPSALEPTNQPEASITITPTAWDPTNNLEVGFYTGT